MDTTEASNTQLARQWFQQVWNEGQKAKIEELCQPDLKAHGLGGQPLTVADFNTLWDTFNETFSDLHVRVHEVLANGDLTATRFTLSGTHVGNGLGVPATNRPVSFDGQAFTRWKDGRISEAWNVLDMASLYRQIGALDL